MVLRSESMHRPEICCLLGAGFSRIAGAPLASELFEHGPPQITSAAALGEFRRVHEAYQEWRTVNRDAHAEKFLDDVHTGHLGAGAVGWPAVVRYVQARLATAGTPPGSYNRNPRYSNRVNVPSKVAAHVELWREAERLGHLHGVVTTNYDLFVERSLRHRPMKRPRLPGFHYGGFPLPQVLRGQPQPFSTFSPAREIELSGRVPLFKLHGSLNWTLVGSRLEMYQDCRAAFRRTSPAAIVPPLPEKERPAWLHQTWDGAARVLAEADVWVICGYSLPEYDEAVRHLLASAAAQQRVILLDPGSASLAEWYGRVLPATEILALPGLPDGIVLLGDALATRASSK